jgi:hypothetical protein
MGKRELDPSAGAPRPLVIWIVVGGLTAWGGLALAAALAVAVFWHPQKAGDGGVGPSIPAGVLWHAYDGNEAEADSKYTGKAVRLYVRGSVVKLRAGHYVVISEGFGKVFCEIDPADNDKLATVKGEPIAFLVRGVCAGRFGIPINQGGDGHSVTVKGCRVLGAAMVVSDGSGGSKWASGWGGWVPPDR